MASDSVYQLLIQNVWSERALVAIVSAVYPPCRLRRLHYPKLKTIVEKNTVDATQIAALENVVSLLKVSVSDESRPQRRKRRVVPGDGEARKKTEENAPAPPNVILGPQWVKRKRGHPRKPRRKADVVQSRVKPVVKGSMKKHRLNREPKRPIHDLQDPSRGQRKDRPATNGSM